VSRRRAIGPDLLRLSRRAARLLTPAALSRVGAFVDSCRAADGGYRGRGGQGGDVYYTLFGVLAGRIAGAADDGRSVGPFLDRQSPEALDLPHLTALVQGLRLGHPLGLPRRRRDTYARALSRYRSPDGGFAETPGGARGSAYALYLALLCHEALGESLPRADAAAAAAAALLEEELAGVCGGLQRLVAAVLAQQALGGAVPAARICESLRACGGPCGGFRAHAKAPWCDLLSTAVAAFGLWRIGAPLRGQDAAGTAQFVHSLWDPTGGFCGSALDSAPDCEYTFYGLLTLGALEP
jgi:hypothetical protein